jgi:hypothetical protein
MEDSPYTDPFNADQAPVRYRIVKRLLSATPATIPVGIRYPIFKYEIQQLDPQLNTDGLGHDDCFLSDSADMGTRLAKRTDALSHRFEATELPDLTSSTNNSASWSET